MDCLKYTRLNYPRIARQACVFAAVVFAAVLFLQPANAAVVCSTVPPSAPLLVGATQLPGSCTSVPQGSLLASLSAPFTSASGKISGTIVSAVYQETGGTLDFLYQVTDNATCPSMPCDPIVRETDTNFAGWLTDVATRTDGGNTSSVTGLGASDPFVNGLVPPLTADRNSTGDTVGWNFTLAAGDQIAPGQTSVVLIIGTNATHFTAGDAFAIDGGVTQVAAFEPTSGSTVPEPTLGWLLGGAMLAMAAYRRFRVS